MSCSCCPGPFDCIGPSCRNSYSVPNCSNEPMCKVQRCMNPAACDQTFLARKDHLYFNSRCQRCSWNQRYDDTFWNHRHGKPRYASRFDAPSPVKPPWCPPGCKSRSYFYPRYYRRNCDGFYPDQCTCEPQCVVRNPCGTSNCECVGCCRRWSIPLCPCPLSGKSRCFPSPCCCGCCPSPMIVKKRLKCDTCCECPPRNPCCGAQSPPWRY